jgi:tRNA (cmo5U34)-methyltransferase
LDNATAHKASDYEAEVVRTIPFHDEILRTAVDVVLAVKPTPRRWLDTGCGPGKLMWMAREVSPDTDVWLADPSEAMLALARERNPHVPADRFVAKRSEDLPDQAALGGRFDAITAIQCHHYGDEAARQRALERCKALLAPDGVLVRAETEAGHAIQRRRWAAWQRRQGRDEADVKKQLDREGTAMFPIRVSEHLALLARLGFDAELVWRAYGQAGFCCTLSTR